MTPAHLHRFGAGARRTRAGRGAPGPSSRKSRGSASSRCREVRACLPIDRPRKGEGQSGGDCRSTPNLGSTTRTSMRFARRAGGRARAPRLSERAAARSYLENRCGSSRAGRWEDAEEFDHARRATHLAHCLWTTCYTLFTLVWRQDEAPPAVSERGYRSERSRRYSLASATSASNSFMSSPSSGCQRTPSAKRFDGSSSASVVPSGARAASCRPPPKSP
jgi:hypothetical protein